MIDYLGCGTLSVVISREWVEGTQCHPPGTQLLCGVTWSTKCPSIMLYLEQS